MDPTQQMADASRLDAPSPPHVSGSKGAEDPIIGTFTVTGDQAQVRQEEIASTKTAAATLTVVVTSVSEQ